MLLSERRDAAEAGGDPSLIGAWSDRQNKRGGMRSDLVLLRRGDSEDGGEVGWFYPDKAARGCNLFMRSWMVFPCRREAGRLKLDVKPQNDPLHHWKIKPRLCCCSFSIVGLFDAVFLSCFSFPFRVRRWMCVRPVEGEMLLEGQWGKAADVWPALVATAPSIGEQGKGVVSIRLFKVVPTVSHHHLSILTSRRKRAPYCSVTSSQSHAE